MINKSFYKVLFLSKERWFKRVQWKFSNNISGVFLTNLALQSGFGIEKRWIKNGEDIIMKIVGAFLAILTLLSGFFEINRIPIKSYFLVKKNGKKRVP